MMMMIIIIIIIIIIIEITSTGSTVPAGQGVPTGGDHSV
jgi:hypothetical protein